MTLRSLYQKPMIGVSSHRDGGRAFEIAFDLPLHDLDGLSIFFYGDESNGAKQLALLESERLHC